MMVRSWDLRKMNKNIKNTKLFERLNSYGIEKGDKICTM